MARPIKVTPEQIDEVIADFKSKLTASKMKGGKFEYTKVFSFVNRKATVYIHELAWLKMKALVDHYSTEVGWFGFSGRVNGEGDNYGIWDIIIPPQQVSGAKVDTDQAEFEKWLDSLPDDQFNALHFQAHSHVNMDCSPSGTDTQTEIDMISRIKTDSFYIFAILNKSGKHSIRIYDLGKNIFFDTADVDIKVVEGDVGVMKMLREAEKVVTEKRYAPVYPQYYGDYSGYYGSGYSGNGVYTGAYSGKSYASTPATKPAEPAKGKSAKKSEKKGKKAGKADKKSGLFDESPLITVKMIAKSGDESDLFDSFNAKDTDTIASIVEEMGFDASIPIRAKLGLVEVPVDSYNVQVQFLAGICGLSDKIDHDLVIICDFGDDENDANASKPHGFADGYGLDDPLDDFDNPYSAFGYM